MSVRWPSWLNAAVLLLASVVAVSTLSLRAHPDSETVAVVFPPWWSVSDALQATAEADAAIVRTTAIASIVVVRPRGREGMARLREAGGWFVVDPQAIAGCLKD